MATSRLVIILGLIAIIISTYLVYIAADYNSTPVKIDNINITIIEKYPVHTYEKFNGKFTSHYIDPATIVDDKGDLYIINNENIWAKMRVNETYNVQYASYPNAQKGKIVGINYIIGDS